MAGSDLFTGSLDILILKSLNWGPLHGYAIGKWIRQWTTEVLPVQEGALYPALHRMERKGLLEEEWGVTETNREAKFYRLTREGKKQLKTDVVRWKAYAQVMTRALAAAQP
jgi:transcriptional regulator